jgi:F-type H+-transporting ATPase subunit b
MLDIQVKWLLVLAANFLGLIFLLNIILFKPLLKIFNEREDTVKGSLEASREMNARREDAVSTMNREIAEARSKAKEIFESKRTEGLNLQKQVLSESESAAADILAKARQELQSEVEKARQSLRGDVEKFSEEIVGKLVKAA